MTRDDFELVESIFGLHPATLPALEVGSGTCSRHFDVTQQRNKLCLSIASFTLDCMWRVTDKT
jgi:hypothetical protein